MGLLSKIKEVQEELTFKFPDGDEVRLRVVDAMSIIPRLGLPPATLSKFMESQKSEVEKQLEHEKALQNVIEDPSLIGVGQRFEEAYWVLGIESVNGEPIKLCFSDEDEPDAIPVSTFKAAVVKGYGEEVLQELEQTGQRLRAAGGGTGQRRGVSGRGCWCCTAWGKPTARTRLSSCACP